MPRPQVRQPTIINNATNDENYNNENAQPNVVNTRNKSKTKTRKRKGLNKRNASNEDSVPVTRSAFRDIGNSVKSILGMLTSTSNTTNSESNEIETKKGSLKKSAETNRKRKKSTGQYYRGPRTRSRSRSKSRTRKRSSSSTKKKKRKVEHTQQENVPDNVEPQAMENTNPSKTEEEEDDDNDSDRKYLNSTLISLRTGMQQTLVKPLHSDSAFKDPQWCNIYAMDIMKLSFEQETKEHLFVPTDYLEAREKRVTEEYTLKKKLGITADVPSIIPQEYRGILIDWLVEVAEEYRLSSNVLHLAVNYVDRSLNHMSVRKSRLQLLGCVCLLLAAKFSVIRPPKVRDLIYISDNTYTDEELIDMEVNVLKALNYRLMVPTSLSFLRRFLLASNTHCVPTKECFKNVPYSKYARDLMVQSHQDAYSPHMKSMNHKVKCMSMYIVELSLQYYSCLNFKRSEMAAAAILYTRIRLHIKPIWNETLVQTTGYQPNQLAAATKAIVKIQAHARAKKARLGAVYEKWSHSATHRVSHLWKYDPSIYDFDDAEVGWMHVSKAVGEADAAIVGMRMEALEEQLPKHFESTTKAHEAMEKVLGAQWACKVETALQKAVQIEEFPKTLGLYPNDSEE